MKYFKIILFLLLFISLLNQSCVSKQREKALLDKITKLENELDECKFGAAKIYKKILISFDSNDFLNCRRYCEEIKLKNSDSPYYDSSLRILDNIKVKEDQIQAKIENGKKEKVKMLKSLRKKYDDVSGITWYYNPFFTHYVNSNHTSIYLGCKEGTEWLRLSISYYADDWIFFEKVYLSYDGNTIEIPFNQYSEKETDNDGGKVWEWIDVSVSDDLYLFLRDFSKSKNAKTRLVGKYSKTFNLSTDEIKGIKDVVTGYEILKDI